MKHLFEWRWVFGFWSSCRPHSDRNRLSLHKVLSDKLWECEAPTCVWSALLLWERNKAFLFFNTSVYAEETALRLNTFIHIFHTSILVATDRVKAMWLTGRCDIQLNLFVTITIPLLSPFCYLNEHTTTCTPWFWSYQSSLGDLKLEMWTVKTASRCHKGPKYPYCSFKCLKCNWLVFALTYHFEVNVG